jgi:hypothetical protein
MIGHRLLGMEKLSGPGRQIRKNVKKMTRKMLFGDVQGL